VGARRGDDPAQAAPRQPEDDAPAGDDRLVRGRGRLGGDFPVPGRSLADQRRGEPQDRASALAAPLGRPGEARARRDAPLRLRVRIRGRPPGDLRAAQGRRDRAAHGARPRDDDLHLLRRPRRQLRGAAVGQFRGLEEVYGVHEVFSGVRRRPHRQVLRPAEDARRTRSGRLRGGAPPARLRGRVARRVRPTHPSI
ncbi:MAG: hypothetical protein AVDCRST_MAG02-1474, partial [uncultured Rubrobacteraceae bacterium]